MRKAVLITLVAVGALWGLVDTANAFCHKKVRTTCIAYYPGLYSFASCGCSYAPYVYSCAYRYPKYHGRHKARWHGRLSCASRNSYGCGYGACGDGGSSCSSCGSCDYGSCGGCGSCGVGCNGCGSYTSNGCGVGCDGCDGGCAIGSSTGEGTSFEVDSKTIYDGPASGAPPSPDPAATDPTASAHQIGFRLTASTRRDGTSAYARGRRSYWGGNMNEALLAFDTAASAEPKNALYQYYRALTFYRLQGPEAAADWLAQAVDLERQSPIKNWGSQMERVQGRARLWVEQARNNASLGR